MKKYLYILTFVLVAVAVEGQNVPNGNFENWTNHGSFSAPDFWHTTDSVSASLGQHSVIQETTVVHGGSSAMKMQSWAYLIYELTAAATNGTLNSTTFLFESGTPDTVRHEALTGWYEYNSAGGDSCTVSVLLTRWNGAGRDTIGFGLWTTKVNAASYTPFSIPLIYKNSGNPDTVLIVVLSAPLGAGSAHPGTVLYIDDLNFSDVAGTRDIPADAISMNVYPNPASRFLTIESKNNAPLKGSVSILDINGKLLQSTVIPDNKQRIDISSLSNGNYFFEMADERGTKVGHGKFSVSH